jgi:hypothetical protein
LVAEAEVGIHESIVAGTEDGGGTGGGIADGGVGGQLGQDAVFEHHEAAVLTEGFVRILERRNEGVTGPKLIERRVGEGRGGDDLLGVRQPGTLS